MEGDERNAEQYFKKNGYSYYFRRMKGKGGFVRLHRGQSPREGETEREDNRGERGISFL